MASYYMEKEELHHFETNWSREEDFDQGLYINEVDHGAPPWHRDDSSESDFDDEPEANEFDPKPLDRCTTTKYYSEPIESWYDEENYYGRNHGVN